MYDVVKVTVKIEFLKIFLFFSLSLKTLKNKSISTVYFNIYAVAYSI